MAEKEENDFKDPWSIGNKFLGLIGAIASISLITILSLFFKWLSIPIITAMGLFISLPIFFTFVWALFKNNPNAAIRTKKYGSILYIIVALFLFFFFFHRPESFMGFWFLLAQFFIGFFLTFITGIIYLMFYVLLKEKSYRIRGGIAFTVSFLITLLIIILTKDLTILKKFL